MKWIVIPLLLILLGIGSGIPTHSASAQTTSQTGIIIPLYSYPGSSWNTIIQQKEANPSVPIIAIINPDSGPGASINSNYVTWINSLNAAGIIVIGYDHTSYGTRSVGAVEADMNAYKSWYNINGIFFDEMANAHGYESYYSTLSNYANSLGFSLTVGNPGATVPASYIGTVNIIVTYENTGLPSLSTLKSSDLGSSVATLSYNVATINSTYIDLEAKYSNYIYITNAALPNPYGVLPAYFSALVSDVAASSRSTVTVQSALSGHIFTGMWTYVVVSNSIIKEGFTSMTFTGTNGLQYTVCADNYQSYVFSHWSNGAITPCTTLTLAGNTKLTAEYVWVDFAATVE